MSKRRGYHVQHSHFLMIALFLGLLFMLQAYADPSPWLALWFGIGYVVLNVFYDLRASKLNIARMLEYIALLGLGAFVAYSFV